MDIRHAATAPPAPLVRLAAADAAAAFDALASRPDGLTEAEAAARLAAHGANQAVVARPPGPLHQLAQRLWTPLNLMLLALAGVSAMIGDPRAAVMIAAMVALSVGLSFVQEYRSGRAAAALGAMVRTTATVLRQPGGQREVPIAGLVPGDVVLLGAGDMVPADLRLVAAKDLFLNQAALTGEALPVEKHASPAATDDGPLAAANLCFMGTNVVSGTGTALVVLTGGDTQFGDIAASVARVRAPTGFERGIGRFVWLMVRLIAVMVPAVFLINGVTKGNWFEALLFAVAVAVGLAPEMLPMIVTMNLAKGCLAMARRRVIVKRMNAIQNFGAMDVLCTDKTGTLTQDRVILKRHLDLTGAESEKVLHYAYLNSFHHTGLRNLLDEAVLAHGDVHRELRVEEDFRKIDEVPFDFERRRMSVVVAGADRRHLMICKGAVEEVAAVCSHCEIAGERRPLDPELARAAAEEMASLNEDGFRVVAVAYRRFDTPRPAYGIADEAGLTLLGYIAFLDPPKDSAAPAIAELGRMGVAVKILTGDNAIVTRKICREVGLPVETILLGHEIEAMTPAELARAAAGTTVFAKLSPAQKAHVIAALQQAGHVVGFLGDGINDGPALRAADVGISVDDAVDIARWSADIILLEKSLGVLGDGVTEGRRVFANIVKYIKMGASSNFGNMLSVVGASLFLPFLPMAPIQVLANNLLYDLSQTAIPTDRVDADYLARPRRWEIGNVLKFMLVIGPVSSIFDYATYGAMLFLFDAWRNPALFQTGWFIESLITQTLIIHVIRTARVPLIDSRASPELTLTTLAVVMAGMVLPFTGLGQALGFVPVPAGYWPVLALLIAGYVALTHLVKRAFIRRFGMD